jgi:thiol-disulfide isomerase/thioredoxin
MQQIEIASVMGRRTFMRGHIWRLIVLMLASKAAGAVTPTTLPDDATLRRGEQVRQVLLGALEQSYQNNGPWPDKFAANGLDLVYAKPKDSQMSAESGSIPRSMSEAPATVVVHERFETHPHGVWVGYADGHVEFASTPTALKSCQSQLVIVARHPAVSATTVPDAATGEVTLKIEDSSGRPVAGAKVGTFLEFGLKRFKKEPPFFDSHDPNDSPVSDGEGKATISASAAFAVKFTDESSVPVYVLDHSRESLAEIRLNRSDFEQRRTIEVRLSPACEVRGNLTSVGLQAVGKNVTWTNVIAFKPGQLGMYTIQCISESGIFEYPLPPGDWGLEAYGTDCADAYRFFHIDPGQRELNLTLDIPPSTVTELVGKPAPEFVKIKGWKNGGPLTMAELRGKFVLLDFWGYWCGPCVQSMPYLMKLDDEEKDKGLAIIAVHDDSLGSIAELDEKLEVLRHEDWLRWKGRNLPFLIALDGGGETRVKYSSFTARGATTAAYGITGFPTTVAIGRNGKVIGEVSVWSDKGRNEIEKMVEGK